MMTITTSLSDARGCAISGATPAAAAHFERAVAAQLAWRAGASRHVERALQAAPSFTMAHALSAYLRLCSRDPHSVRSAAPVLAQLRTLPANARERLHIAVIGAALDDDLERAKDLLGELLRSHPHDLLALHVVHSFDHMTSDAARMHDRVAGVRAAWSHDAPGYHAVVAMHAFSLVECGDYAQAEREARAALELNPLDARACHAMAHVFEMTQRPDAGLRWMHEHVARWSVDTVVATHVWWHMALFHLELNQPDRALALYDRHVRPTHSTSLADLIDAAALLWRVRLHGGDTGARWAELAQGWAPHIADAYCSFSDLHAMLAFVGARDWSGAKRLELELAERQHTRTRHGQSTRRLGLPACRALIAFGRGDDARAIPLLAGLTSAAHGFGGSHAQRDVLYLTLVKAIERVRRPRRPIVPRLEALAS